MNSFAKGWRSLYLELDQTGILIYWNRGPAITVQMPPAGKIVFTWSWRK